MTRALITCCCLLLPAAHCACAQPNEAELKSYKCLTPDWSKTSGGSSPTLSPDGKTLFYLVRNVGVGETEAWVMPRVNSYNPASDMPSGPVKPPEPWRIDATPPEQRIQITEYGDANYRNADWSPDGRRVAFVLKGRLFLAENIDSDRKRADVRMIADSKSTNEAGLKSYWSGLGTGRSELANPRWSPDGTKIAFLRTHFGRHHSVCVYDVGTGKETIAAQDANYGPHVYGQPWSPDSLKLAYTSVREEPHGNKHMPGRQTMVELGGISIVPAAGGPSRKVIGHDNVAWPSWSPRGDKIAYVETEWSKDRRSNALRIWVTDPSGKNRKRVSPGGAEVSKTLSQAELFDRYAVDMEPAWSPDGASIAYIRRKVMSGPSKLMLTKLGNSATRALFTASLVGNQTWTRDGKSIVVQGSRNLAFRREDQLSSVTMPSYPEIWVIDPR